MPRRKRLCARPVDVVVVERDGGLRCSSPAPRLRPPARSRRCRRSRRASRRASAARTRIPVRIRDSARASTACRSGVSAPSSLISANANGLRERLLRARLRDPGPAGDRAARPDRDELVPRGLAGVGVVLGGRHQHAPAAGAHALDPPLAQGREEAAEHRADRAAVGVLQVVQRRERRVVALGVGGHPCGLEHVPKMRVHARRPRVDGKMRDHKEFPMKLGLQLGYWQATATDQPRGARAGSGAARLRLGLDRRGVGLGRVHAAGVDRRADLARSSSAPAIVQISARTPAATAMHALTLDHLSSGRVILGLGVSGPQVVEGWYGQPFGKPLARTREYVAIMRKILRARGAGHERGTALSRCPTPGRARGDSASRCARSCTRCARTCRSTSAPRARRTSRCRRDRRRLAAALLLAVPARGLRGRRSRGKAKPRLRDRAGVVDGEHDRRRARRRWRR